MSQFCRILIQIVVLPVTSLVHWKMWQWFITPTLGIAPPNKWMILGLVMWLAVVTHNIPFDRSKKTEIEKWTDEVITPLFRTFLLILFGAIYHYLGTN